MEKFRWAYIGCGSIAYTTARELVKSENNEIVAVWNRTYEKAEKFAKKFGGTPYRTFEEVMNDKRVDGVYIALTADRHCEYMKKCIEHHKPVLCEKPFTINAAEAKEVFDLAKKEGVYIAEAMWTWHNEPALKVKEWLKENKTGTIREVKCDYKNPATTFSKNSRLFDANRIGGALMDIGVYGLRYSLELFGRPDKVVCEGRMSKGVDLGEKVDFIYDTFTVHHDIALDQRFSEHYTIKGDKGEIKVPMFHMARKAQFKGETKDEVKTKDLLYERQFTNIANEIRQGLKESEIIRPEMTLACMEIMDECRRQMDMKYPSEIETDKEVSYAVTLSHLGFNCKDIDRSIAFYRDILGCKVKFIMTYGDMIDDIKKTAKEKGEKEPFYLKAMEKMKDTKWSVYMSWTENTFIELFYIPRARKKNIPDPTNGLNYTHYSLQASDLKKFREQVIARGGAPYIDKEIAMGMDNTWVMWMKDPDGNPFEIMEYTPDSYQVKGR